MHTLKRAAILAGAAGALALGLATAPGAQASTPQCSALGPSCGDNQNQFGNAWDVAGQTAAYNRKVISWPNTTSDPATDFIRTGTNPYRYEYAPKGAHSGFCVADPGGGGVPASDPDGLVLRACNTGNFQRFQLGKVNKFGAQQLVNVATNKPVYTNGTGNQLTGGGAYSGGSYWSWAGGKSLTVVAPSSFSLRATGDASATCQFHQEVLNAGIQAGAGAYVQVNNAPAAAPGAAPGFTTSAEAGGTPRWVIEFHNGQLIDGWPAAAATSADSGTWTWSAPFMGVNNTTYSAALAAATGPSAGLDNWVTAAFIVNDQSAGTPGSPQPDATLTGVQYAGITYTC